MLVPNTPKGSLEGEKGGGGTQGRSLTSLLPAQGAREPKGNV